MILETAGLSFLGLGVQDGVSWGLMLAESTQEVPAGHFANFAAASGMLFALLMGFNLLADALQDLIRYAPAALARLMRELARERSFLERIVNGDTAWEVGYYKVRSKRPDQEPRIFYGKFHVLLRKIDGRVCALGISGILSCWDAGDGRPLWRKEFASELDAKKAASTDAWSALYQSLFASAEFRYVR